MMTKSLLPLILILVFSANAMAYDFKVDGLCYNKCPYSNSVMITQELEQSSSNYKSLIGDIVIPKRVIYKGKSYTVSQIEDWAFDGCTGLTSVTIPNSVTKIGDNAFYGCTDLSSVTIPNSVTEIGGYAFQKCTSLTSVTIPDSVTVISGYAFEGCTALKSATLPNSVTVIGGSAFEGCTALKSIIIPDSVIEIGGSAFEGCTALTSITIPNSVTNIGFAAFKGCTELKSVIIPNSVTEIGELAFYGCTSLASVLIPNSVTWIDHSTFYGCTSLTSVTIPNSVSWIGEFVFYGCTALTSITIPNSVTWIGNGAFWSCSGLISINVEPTNTTFDSRENCNAIIETATNSLIVGCKNTQIPTTVKKISGYAFDGCSGLTTVNIPNSVTEIDINSFAGCTNLVSINVEPTNTTFDSRENCNAIIETASDSLFVGCKNTQIPATIRKIGGGAFNNCIGLTSVIIPNSVTEIGVGAFMGCTGLTSVTIPNSVIGISTNAFARCSALTSVIIPDSVTEIGSFAFDACTALTSVIIPNSVKTIGSYAFEGCTALTSVTIPNSVTWIESGAFKGCSGLSSVIIPNSVKTIGSYAFENCTALKSVAIPNSVTTIGSDTFKGCTGLISVAISKSVTEIGNSVFSSCPNLVSINVEPTNTTFDSRENCNAIIETATNSLIVGCEKSLIPATVRVIGRDAFYGCTGLTSVTIPDSVIKIDKLAFYGCTGLTSVTIPNSVIEIGSGAFWGCTSLTSVTIPNSVTKQFDYAFSDFTGLTSMVISTSVAEIDDYAFTDFTALTTVTIPNSVTKIGKDAFAGCTGLTSVTIPNSVTEIGRNAFKGCIALKSVTIPKSVTRIDVGAFENCINMESIICWNKTPQNISADITAFKDVNKQTCNLLVPLGCIESYSSVTPWLYFTNKIEDGSITINDTESVEQEPLSLKQKFQHYYSESQYDKAINIGELLLAQQDYRTDRTNASLIEDFAFCYYKEKNFSKAKEYYEILDTVFANINEPDSYAKAYRNELLGDCCMETNDYVRAENHYSKAYHNYLLCDSPSIQIQMVITLFKLHSCFIAQGKLLESVDPYLECKSIQKDIIGKLQSAADLRFWWALGGFYDHLNLSRILRCGNNLCDQNRFEEALMMYVDGTLLYQKIKGEQSLEVAIMHGRIGQCYLLMQQYDQALSYLNLSKEILEKTYQETIDDFLLSDASIRENSIFSFIRDDDYDDLILDYGIYYASQGDFESSYIYLRNSLDYIFDHSLDFLGNNTSEERSTYWEKNSQLFCEVYPYVVAMAVDKRFNRHNTAGFNYSDIYGDLYNKSALFAKGLLLTSDNEFSRIIDESGDSILISRLKELESLKSHPGPLSDEQSKIIEDEATKIEKELIVVSKDYSEFINNLQLTWEDVQARLSPTDIAIEFLSFPQLGSDKTFYIALTVRKDYDRPHLVFLCQEHKLKAAAKKAYTGNKVSRLIWGKLSKELEGVQNIYFSPSGVLHQLAIESIPHWKKTKSLMNQCYNIYRLSSTRELAINRKNIQPRTAALYGGIEYNTPVDSMGSPRKVTDQSLFSDIRGFDADSAGYRGKEWKNLKNAQIEVDSIATILRKKEIDVYKKTQTAATETSFKDMRGQRKSIIHIATHGFCWNDSVAREKSRKSLLSFMGNGLNAMTRTGLLFSGANHCFKEVKDSSDLIPKGVDDGVLTAMEVSLLDLRGLDLLVLSACETGLGEVSAEGVFGLQRGFKKAGAQSIIMSLWTVNDKATSEMMTQFYKYYTNESGMSKHDAFLKAQQFIKNKYGNFKDEKHTKPTDRPHWAAFILLDALDNR